METLQRQKKVTKQKQGTKEKPPKFLRTRMWFSTLVSLVTSDSTTIPSNIGNNVHILNNMYITKHSLSAVLVITEMSTDTPLGVWSDLLKHVKSNLPNVTVDVTIKNKPTSVNTSSGDMKSRVRGWEKTLDNPFISEGHKLRAARLLYSLDVIRSGATVYNSSVLLTVRAPDGWTLRKGIATTEKYLQSIGAVYRLIKSDIKFYMGYSLIMSDLPSKKNKDIPKLLMTSQTLAETLPTTQGYNDISGSFLGIDRESNSGYYINFRKSPRAKNIIIAANSGWGKTALAQNWFLDMYADDYNMCIMDVKGTEFTGFTKAANGTVISLKPDSTYYVNTFKLDAEEIRGDSLVYFDERITLSKKVMIILAALTPAQEAEGEALLEEFLFSMYLTMGVSNDNPNSWQRTANLTPYSVFEELDKYLSPNIMAKYGSVAKKILSRLSIYMSPNGTNSHMFKTPLDYKDILEKKVICFNFGLLDAGQNTDVAMFQVKALFMSVINEQFVSYKAAKGEWTGKVLEESGVAEDYLLKLYAKDFMLRRSQNQVTILLGNSISGLASNANARGILENATVLAIGSLSKTSRDYLVSEYGLEDYEDKLDSIQTDPDYENTFLLINRMEKNATSPMLKVHMPKRVVDGKLFRIVDTECEPCD